MIPREPDDDAAARQLRELEGCELQLALPIAAEPPTAGPHP